MNKLVTLLCASTLLLGSSAVSASLIVNGGFESNDVAANSWQWFTSNNVEGWNGSNIEIWDTFSGVNAVEGNQFAELNAHPSNGEAFSIFQTFGTQEGSYYDLSFAYRARSSNNEAFLMSLIGSGADNINLRVDDHVVGKWSRFDFSFQATHLYTTLMFTALTPSTGTVGNFLDDISVTTSPAVLASTISEPSSIAIMLIGVSLLFTRKQWLAKIRRINA